MNEAKLIACIEPDVQCSGVETITLCFAKDGYVWDFKDLEANKFKCPFTGEILQNHYLMNFVPLNEVDDYIEVPEGKYSRPYSR